MQSSSASNEDHVSTDKTPESYFENESEHSADEQEIICKAKSKLIIWHLMPRKVATCRRTAENVFSETLCPTRYAKQNINTMLSAFQLFFIKTVTDEILK